jgi:hypothetical protein
MNPQVLMMRLLLTETNGLRATGSILRGGVPLSNPPTGTVTFLFTDIEGSTALWERYPEAMESTRRSPARQTRSRLSSPHNAFCSRKRGAKRAHSAFVVRSTLARLKNAMAITLVHRSIAQRAFCRQGTVDKSSSHSPPRNSCVTISRNPSHCAIWASIASKI